MCGLLLFLAFILLAAGWDSVLRAFVIYPLIYLFGRALYEKIVKETRRVPWQEPHAQT